MLSKINSLSGYFHEYQKSVQNPEAFWASIAETFYWRKKWWLSILIALITNMCSAYFYLVENLAVSFIY